MRLNENRDSLDEQFLLKRVYPFENMIVRFRTPPNCALQMKMSSPDNGESDISSEKQMLANIQK